MTKLQLISFLQENPSLTKLVTENVPEIAAIPEAEVEFFVRTKDLSDNPNDSVEILIFVRGNQTPIESRNIQIKEHSIPVIFKGTNPK